MLGAAASAGHLDACQLLKDRGCPWGYFQYLTAAARGGNRAVVEWILEGGCPWSDEALYEAARGGHLELIDWLLQRRPAMGAKLSARELLCAAAEALDFPSFRWLLIDWLARQPAARWQQQRQLEFEDKVAILAAATGSPTPDWRDKVDWLVDELYCHPTPPATLNACHCPGDGLERLVWLRERGFPLFLKLEWVLEMGRHGDTAVLRYLEAEARGTVPAVLDVIAGAAARCGDLALLQSVHGGAQPGLSAEVLTAAAGDAAARGHLPVLIWVMEEALPRLGRGGGRPGPAAPTETPRGLVAAAAEAGHLEVLRWLLLDRRDVEMRAADLAAAVRGGCEVVMGLLLERGCPVEDRGELYGIAASNGDVATLRWLRTRLPYKPDQRLLSACLWLGDPLPVLRWVVQEAGSSPEEVEAAVERAERAGGLKPKSLALRVRAWLAEVKLRRLQA